MKAEGLRGHLDGLVLAVLEQAPLHGYGIIQALAMRSGGTLDVPAGTVYPALYRLESADLVASSWDTTSGRRRRVYDLTRSGLSALRRERDDWRELSTAIGAILGGGQA